MTLRVPWTAQAIGWGRTNQRRLRAERRLREGYPNPIPRARLYEAALVREGSYGRVARLFGVTREEVCHYVTVVRRLPPEFVRLVEAERDPLRVKAFNLRRLLRLARVASPRAQVAAIEAMMRELPRLPVGPEVRAS